MSNIYHSDIYQFNKPVPSYWEATSSENLNLDKLQKDISSEIVVIGGGYTGLLCAINLIENYNLDVILIEAGKIGWGASSRNGGFCSFPPIKTSFKKLQKIYGKEETKKFFRNAVEGSNYTKDIISNYNIDCDVTGENNFVVAHHKNKFDQIKEQAEVYKSEFGIETKVYSKEEFDEVGHGGTEQFGAFSYKPGFAINPLKFVNGLTKYALSKKLQIYEYTKVEKIEKENRIDFWLGIGVATWSIAIISTLIGYSISEHLNKEMMIGLAIVNPVYFTCIMIGAMKTFQITSSIILGAILGPAFYFISPEWCILYGGLIAGTLGYFVGEKK